MDFLLLLSGRVSTGDGGFSSGWDSGVAMRAVVFWLVLCR